MNLKCEQLQNYYDEQCEAYWKSSPFAEVSNTLSAEEYEHALYEYDSDCHAFEVDLIQQLERVTGSDNCPIASQCTICSLDLEQDVLESAEDQDCLEDEELDCLEIDDGLHVPDYE